MLHKIFEGLDPSIRQSLEKRLYSMLIDISEDKVADIRSILRLAKDLKKD
jgi:hypothetical protein